MSTLEIALPPNVAKLSDQELADYCYLRNFTASPLVAEFVRRIEARQLKGWETEEVRAIFKGYAYNVDVGQLIDDARWEVLDLVEESDEVDTVGGVFDDLYAEVQSAELFSPRDGIGEAAYEAAEAVSRRQSRQPSHKKPNKPGPKDTMYLPAILEALGRHALPLKRRELVEAVLELLTEGKEGSVYAAILRAERQQLIVKDGVNRFRRRPKH